MADLAAQYVWICMPGIFWYYHAMALQMYCQSHKVLVYALCGMIGAAIVHGCILGIFCAYDMQFMGVCVGSSV